MSAEAGGPRVYISTAYDATLSAIEAKLPEIDDCDGEMSTLVTNFAAASADWTLISELRDNVTIKFIEETEDIQFLYKLCPTYDVETVRGIQEISFTYNERDVDGLNTLLTHSVKSTTAASTDQTGQNILTFGSLPAVGVYRQLLFLYRNANDLGTVALFQKVKIAGQFDLSMGNEVTKIPNRFKVFAHEGIDEAVDILKVYEITASET